MEMLWGYVFRKILEILMDWKKNQQTFFQI